MDSLLLTDPLKVLKTIAVDAIEKEVSDLYNKMDLCRSNDLISCVWWYTFELETFYTSDPIVEYSQQGRR